MHDPMIRVSFLSIAIELISSKHSPMLLVPICFRFQKALRLKEVLKMLLNLTKALNRLDAVLS